MIDLKKLEVQYLKAKIEYYEGNPLMTDSEFDSLEQLLIKNGSKVHEQVGSKRKDFDFPHPTKMLSLSKVQTGKNKDGSTDYVYDKFLTWYNKRESVTNERVPTLYASPKFDGSAINIIYRDGNIESILTRGDGLTGKNVTKRLKSHVPEKIDMQGIVEIRCEVVVNVNVFKEKYAKEFANARNFVAGVIGKDDMEQDKLNDLTLIPLHFIVDGYHVSQWEFLKYPAFSTVWNKPFAFREYEQIIKDYEKLRESFHFQLDGVVIAFTEDVRKELGENDHDPEWSLAVKFVPDEVVTIVNGIEWNVSKRGELCPVVLLEPIQLAGTTVKRASGYNAGYLKNNGIGTGALVSIQKAGDIIPEVKSVISETPETFVLPHQCPICKTQLIFDEIHLQCPNEECEGRVSKKLSTGAGILDLKGIAGERLKPFAADFSNMYELFKWVLENGDNVDIEAYGIENNGRLHEIFANAFKNVKSLPYEKVVQLLGYDNVGRKITQQLAREHAGLDFSYASLERALVDKLHTPEVESYIKEAVSTLESLGVTIDRPQANKVDIFATGVCLTGSPKEFGFKTKAEFLAKYPNLYEVDLKDATYLVTDDLSSTSSKMENAKKKGIEIKTYGQF